MCRKGRGTSTVILSRTSNDFSNWLCKCRGYKNTTSGGKNLGKKIWYLCLVLITVICLFLQGTPTSPIPLRQRDEAQIHGPFTVFLKEQSRVKTHGRISADRAKTCSKYATIRLRECNKTELGSLRIKSDPISRKIGSL